MIAINRCVYADYSSVDFNLCCQLAFDSDSGESDSFLNREAVASESYRGSFKRVHNYKYQDVFAPTITFIKRDFGDFTLEEQRRILKWLTSKDTPSFLTVYHDDSEIISYEILGAFTEITPYKIGNGRTVGYVAKFESIAPWAFSQLNTIIKDVSDPTDNIVTVEVETDDAQNAIYPRITIQQDSLSSVVQVGHAMTDADEWIEDTVYYYNKDKKYYWLDADGVKHNSATNDSGFETTSVSITNTHETDTEFKTIVKHDVKGETVVLDGANKIVSSSRANGRIFGDDFDFKWMPLHEGKNVFSVIGNCTIKLEWREPRKVGDF